jgi:hypothetical protein
MNLYGPISSSGQDSWFSPSRPGFDSPYGNFFLPLTEPTYVLSTFFSSIFAMFSLLARLTSLNGGQSSPGTPEEPTCFLDSVWGCDFTPPEPIGSPGVPISDQYIHGHCFSNILLRGQAWSPALQEIVDPSQHCLYLVSKRQLPQSSAIEDFRCKVCAIKRKSRVRTGMIFDCLCDNGTYISSHLSSKKKIGLDMPRMDSDAVCLDAVPNKLPSVSQLS